MLKKVITPIIMKGVLRISLAIAFSKETTPMRIKRSKEIILTISDIADSIIKGECLKTVTSALNNFEYSLDKEPLRAFYTIMPATGTNERFKLTSFQVSCN